jgi:hypothetical protein
MPKHGTSCFIALIGVIFFGQQPGVHSVECYACEKSMPSQLSKGGSCTTINFDATTEKDFNHCSVNVVNKSDEC